MVMEGKDHVLFASVALILSAGFGGSVNVVELMKLCPTVLLICCTIKMVEDHWLEMPVHITFITLFCLCIIKNGSCYTSF